jgi:acetyl-CoA acetyltransferase family protein
MPNAYIVTAVRSAGGKKNGRLSKWHPITLGAAVLDGLVEKAGIEASLVDDVIAGCVSQNGGQAGNIARNMVLASERIPESVPGTSVDRQCGSSQQAIHFACQAVMSGTQDVVIACGVEHMSSVPIGSNVADSFAAGHGLPIDDNINRKYGERLKARGQRMFSQFEGAEILAETYNISREEMDQFALASHKKAAAATAAGRFKSEIIPLQGTDKQGNQVLHDSDEGFRPNSTIGNLQKLKSLKELQSKGKKHGLITAGLASQICDGAAAVLICNEDGLKKLGVKPRAKVVALALAGSDPVMMLGAPIPATQTALAKAGLKIEDIDIYEVNEAFASVPLAWAKELGADLEKLNVNGGAMALGHPLGGTGAKLMTTLVHELERRNARYGIQAICEGGGTANAMIIERIPRTQSKL